MIKVKKFLAFTLFLPLILGILSPAFAQGRADPDWTPPERNGIYDVPGRPDLKVRVFVHQPPTSSPILSCPDTDSSAVDGVTGWHLPATWVYRLNSASAPSSVASSLSTIASEAFSKWSAPSNVTFTPGAETTINRQKLDYQNVIAWGRTQGTALAVTYTWYYTADNTVADVDTIMNKKFAWTWTSYSQNACANPNSYDAQNILTHELGHWMGLDDEYDASYVNNTMYGYGAKGEIKKDTPASGDLTTIHAIY